MNAKVIFIYIPILLTQTFLFLHRNKTYTMQSFVRAFLKTDSMDKGCVKETMRENCHKTEHLEVYNLLIIFAFIKVYSWLKT